MKLYEILFYLILVWYFKVREAVQSTESTVYFRYFRW
jgi:hypothetical protein